MRRIHVITVFSALSLAAAGFASAQEPAPTAPPASAPGHHHKTDLQKNMDRIAKAYKRLGKQIHDPDQNASSLDLVAQIHDAANDSLTLKPLREADQPADQQAHFQEQYEAAMKQFIAATDDLAAALKANDNDKAAVLYKKLDKLMDKGHHEFRKPEHHRGGGEQPPPPPPSGGDAS
jgi:hypothetical protein